MLMKFFRSLIAILLFPLCFIIRSLAKIWHLLTRKTRASAKAAGSENVDSLYQEKTLYSTNGSSSTPFGYNKCEVLHNTERENSMNGSNRMSSIVTQKVESSPNYSNDQICVNQSPSSSRRNSPRSYLSPAISQDHVSFPNKERGSSFCSRNNSPQNELNVNTDIVNISSQNMADGLEQRTPSRNVSYTKTSVPDAEVSSESIYISRHTDNKNFICSCKRRKWASNEVGKGDEEYIYSRSDRASGNCSKNLKSTQMFNKQSELGDNKSTHLVFKGRRGVSKYASRNEKKDVRESKYEKEEQFTDYSDDDDDAIRVCSNNSEDSNSSDNNYHDKNCCKCCSPQKGKKKTHKNKWPKNLSCTDYYKRKPCQKSRTRTKEASMQTSSLIMNVKLNKDYCNSPKSSSKKEDWKSVQKHHLYDKNSSAFQQNSTMKECKREDLSKKDFQNSNAFYNKNSSYKNNGQSEYPLWSSDSQTALPSDYRQNRNEQPFRKVREKCYLITQEGKYKCMRVTDDSGSSEKKYSRLDAGDNNAKSDCYNKSNNNLEENVVRQRISNFEHNKNSNQSNNNSRYINAQDNCRDSNQEHYDTGHTYRSSTTRGPYTDNQFSKVYTNRSQYSKDQPSFRNNNQESSIYDKSTKCYDDQDQINRNKQQSMNYCSRYDNEESKRKYQERLKQNSLKSREVASHFASNRCIPANDLYDPQLSINTQYERQLSKNTAYNKEACRSNDNNNTQTSRNESQKSRYMADEERTRNDYINGDQSPRKSKSNYQELSENVCQNDPKSRTTDIHYSSPAKSSIKHEKSMSRSPYQDHNKSRRNCEMENQGQSRNEDMTDRELVSRNDTDAEQVIRYVGQNEPQKLRSVDGVDELRLHVNINCIQKEQLIYACEGNLFLDKKA